MSLGFGVQASEPVQEYPTTNPSSSSTVAQPGTDSAEQIAIALDTVPASHFRQKGVASWYGKRFHGRKTASGERFDQTKMTAAHKRLPFGSIVRVRNTSTGDAVLVRINDRGPFSKSRVIDLSAEAADRLNLNLAAVSVDALTPVSPNITGTNTVTLTRTLETVELQAPAVDTVFQSDDFHTAEQMWTLALNETVDNNIFFIIETVSDKNQSGSLTRSYRFSIVAASTAQEHPQREVLAKLFRKKK